jgi:chromosome partitioning protein
MITGVVTVIIIAIGVMSRIIIHLGIVIALTRMVIRVINTVIVYREEYTAFVIMAQIIQIQSFKGGVGKTTTAVNLSHAFARKNKRVLLIDLDHQGNATSGLGYKMDVTTPALYHVLVGDLKWEDAVATVRENLDLLPSNRMTALAEGAMYPMLSRESILKRKLETAGEEYDLIVLDCPASLGILHINALFIATHIVVPVQIGIWSVDGLEQIFRSMEEVGTATGRMPEVLGALLTMIDERYKLTEEIRELVGDSFGGKLLPPIRTDADLMNAPKNRETIFEYNASSKGAEDYANLANYLLKKLRTQKEGKEEKGSAKIKKTK